MNIEIANRLVHLRKSNHLSQEALAEKLGISRQAVSKWERAEASPDTDNLILLAKLYHVSLDELLKTEEDEEGEEMQNPEVSAFQMKNEEEELTEEEPTGKELTKEDLTQMLRRAMTDKRGFGNTTVRMEENTLSVNISRLRKKLGRDRIRTVQGIGYLWEENA